MIRHLDVRKSGKRDKQRQKKDTSGLPLFDPYRGVGGLFSEGGWGILSLSVCVVNVNRLVKG